MPTFYYPAADAAEASEALRGLAHATRSFEHPEDLYPVIGDLISGVRSLQQVLDQLANAHITHHTRASDDNGNVLLGASTALDTADKLHEAATALEVVQDRINAASALAGRIAWPVPSVDGAQVDTGRRWISVVFLQGEDADQVLDLIDRDGIDAALTHLQGWDYGEETTGAALENGHVYDLDELPTGPLDREASSDGYRMVYNPQMGHVALYRQHTIPAEDRFDTSPVPASAAASGIGPLDNDASTSSAGVPARWVEVTRATGAAADRVFGILTTLGHVDAIDHLAQWDHGDDGPILDALPTAPGVQMLESGKYALAIDTARREFALYRHDAPARPSRGAGRNGPELLVSNSSPGTATPSRDRKESGRSGGASWFAHPGVEAVKRERGLGR
ncbi:MULTISPECIES: hypothetical protein [Kocuria]|uniref:hypothetical protein n=1 Tax=Kocuria TaxID=57493 RepID=UPI0008A43935|nr:MULTISPECIES: hypothetical protein [Kocuria]OFK07120.1 hypothetical protein HMPREF2833_10970 [Kocuria sp. HMSC066H03]PKZ38990.1 hypothetical protein CYJ75_07800 [Kocuria rhizophila]